MFCYNNSSMRSERSFGNLLPVHPRSGWSDCLSGNDTVRAYRGVSMYERQNTRTVADELSSLEQDVQPFSPLTPARPDSVFATHFGSDRNVLSHMDCWRIGGPGSVQCTVAGLFYRYSYTWSDLVSISEFHRGRRLEFHSVDGYSRGHSRCSGVPDDLQSGPVSRFSAALEMAEPRHMATVGPLSDLQLCDEKHPSGRRIKYKGVGPGQTELVFCVVQQYPAQFSRVGDSLPSVTCNRCDLDYESGRRSYHRFRDGFPRDTFEHVYPVILEEEELIDKVEAPW